MTDWLAYDVSQSGPSAATRTNWSNPGLSSQRGDPVNNVSDVKLALSYQTHGRRRADCRLKLTKQDYVNSRQQFGADNVVLFITRPGSTDRRSLIGEAAS